MQMSKLGILCIIGLSCLVFSCTKNDTNQVVNPPANISGFSSTVQDVTLSAANDSATVTEFKWQTPSYGFSVANTYTMIFDVPSDTSGATAWGNAIKINVPSGSVNKSFFGMDFNKIMNQLGLPYDVATPIVVRLKSDINQSTGAASTVPTVYSDLSMTVTPYQVILIYPKLFVAGDVEQRLRCGRSSQRQTCR